MNPPANECPICVEKYSSLKILTCGHKFCARCLSTIVEKQEPCIECPTCRENHKMVLPVDQLPTLHFGFITCNICFQQKSTEDTWWCPTCVQLICSTCHITHHQKFTPQHQISKWENLQVIKDCYSHSEKLSQKEADLPIGPENTEKIQGVCKDIEKFMLEKIRGRMHDSSQDLFQKHVFQFFGDVSGFVPQANDLIETSYLSRIAGVAKQAMKVACEDSCDDELLDEMTKELSNSEPKKVETGSFADTLVKQTWCAAKVSEELPQLKDGLAQRIEEVKQLRKELEDCHDAVELWKKEWEENMNGLSKQIKKELAEAKKGEAQRNEELALIKGALAKAEKGEQKNNKASAAPGSEQENRSPPNETPDPPDPQLSFWKKWCTLL